MKKFKDLNDRDKDYVVALIQSSTILDDIEGGNPIKDYTSERELADLLTMLFNIIHNKSDIYETCEYIISNYIRMKRDFAENNYEDDMFPYSDKDMEEYRDIEKYIDDNK